MSRFPRVVLPGVPLHIIQRGNNRNPCFFTLTDFQVYRSLLGEHSARLGCQVHAYALMTNHVHILATPSRADSAAALMKHVGQTFVQYINRKHGRLGTLWQGRYRSAVVGEERYFLTCQRYIELNPVRAGMVAHPADYDWSSYHANAHGHRDAIVVPHPIYTAIATDAQERLGRYRSLLQEQIPDSDLEAIRRSANQNAVFGSQVFIDSVGASAGREFCSQKKGRKYLGEF